jgi:hypothetical protein
MQRNELERGHGARYCPPTAELKPRGAAAGHTMRQQLPGSAHNAVPAWDFSMHQADAARSASNQNQGLMTWAVPRS